MADEVVRGLSAESKRIPSKWNRQTVADGSWLQKYTLNPLSSRDVYLAEQIDKGNGDVTYVSGKVDELSGKTLVLSGELNSTSSFLSGAIDNVSAGVDFVSAGVDGVSSIFDDFHTNEYEQFVSDVTQSASDLNGKIDEVASDLADEIVDRTNADTELQNQIDKLEAATDVICVYGTYSGYDNSFSNASGDLFKEPEHLTENDVIKVLNDNSDTGEGGQTYWQATNVDWETSSCTWTRIGKLEPYYTKSEINTITGNITSDISNTYLSAKGAVHQGKNIVVTEDSTKPEITIATSANVEFTTVSSNGFSGTNISGATKNDTIDNLFNSAYKGAEASAWIYDNSARLDIQAGYGLETGVDEGHLVIGLHQDQCDYYGHSLALGSWSTANGNNSYAFGMSCVTIGGAALAIGDNARATTGAVALGTYNSAMGKYSLALGYNSTAFNETSVAIGKGLSGEAPITLGTWNDNVAGATFIIGDGTGTQEGYDVVRKNALVIKDGLVSGRDFSAGNVSLSSLTDISAFGNGITNTAKFNLSAVKLSAGEGIGFKNDTNGVLSITAEGRAYTGENYVKVDNTTKKISLSGDLVGSAELGQSAYDWITTKSATLSAGSGINFNSAAQNTLGISVKYTTTNGYVTELDGIPLSAGANYTQGRCIPIDAQNKINLSSDINLDTKLVIDHYNSSDPETFASATLESYKLDFSGSRDNGGSFRGKSATYRIDNLKIDNYSDTANLNFAELDESKLQLSAFNKYGGFSVNTYTNITNTYYETQLAGGPGPYYMKFNGEKISAGSDTGNVTAANWASIISAANGRFVSATTQEIVIDAPHQTKFVVTASIPGSLNANTYYII